MGAPNTRKFAALWGDMIHGRRINDEVELFEDADGTVSYEDIASDRFFSVLIKIPGVTRAAAVTRGKGPDCENVRSARFDEEEQVSKTEL